MHTYILNIEIHVGSKGCLAGNMLLLWRTEDRWDQQSSHQTTVCLQAGPETHDVQQKYFFVPLVPYIFHNPNWKIQAYSGLISFVWNSHRWRMKASPLYSTTGHWGEPLKPCAPTPSPFPRLSEALVITSCLRNSLPAVRGYGKVISTTESFYI